MTKEEFIEKYEGAWLDSPSLFVVAIKFPNGKGEIITNSEGNIENKYLYYLEAYDDNMRLKSNPDIRIVDFMLI